MIAKGVRFNAEKKQVGNYYSTKVQVPSYVFLWGVDCMGKKSWLWGVAVLYPRAA